MNIISGISNIFKEDALKQLIDAGIDEFFIGYVPAKWSDKFGYEVSCNRRQYSSFQYNNIAQLEKLVNYIQGAGKKIFLTFNAHEYNNEQIEIVYNIIKEIEHIPFDAYIVSNMALMLYLRDKRIDIPFNISIGGGCNNYESIDFYKKYIDNIYRVILPRKLTIKEIEEIALQAKKNEVRLEAFGMAFSCVFNDEYCFAWHDAINVSFCQSPLYEYKEAVPILTSKSWKTDVFEKGLGGIYQKRQELDIKISELKQKYKNNRSVPIAKNADFSRMYILSIIEKCGLCAFKKFKEWGIDAIKLPLRGYNIEASVAMIKLVRTVLDTNNADIKFCQNLLGYGSFCRGENCYYNYPYPN